MYLNRNQTTLLILAAAVSHSVSNPAGTNQEKSRTANIHLGSNTVLLTKLASCTDAPPFAEEPFPIAYANVQPDSNWTNYKLSDSWYSNHYLSGPHVCSRHGRTVPYPYSNSLFSILALVTAQLPMPTSNASIPATRIRTAERTSATMVCMSFEWAASGLWTGS